MDYSQVSPHLYVGSCPACPEDVDRLVDELGVSAVVNLQTEVDLAYCEIDWPRMEAHYRQAGVEVRRVPIEDFNPDSLRRNLARSVEAVEELLESGHTVFVHCNMGINRSPSAVITYLNWIEGWDLEEAINHVMHCRSCDPYVEAIRRATADRAKRDEG